MEMMSVNADRRSTIDDTDNVSKLKQRHPAVEKSGLRGRLSITGGTEPRRDKLK
jgi:hypothetical protein